MGVNTLGKRPRCIMSSSMYTELRTPLMKKGRTNPKEIMEEITVYGITEKGYEQVTGKKKKIESETPEEIYKLLLRNEVYFAERKKNPQLEFLTDDEVYGIGLIPARDEYIFYDDREIYLMLSFVERVKLPESLDLILDRKTVGSKMTYREIIHHIWLLINDESQREEMNRLMDEQQTLNCHLYLLLPAASDKE